MSIHPPSSNLCAPPVEDARVSIELQLLVNQVMVLHRIECQEKTPNLVSTDIVALQGGWPRRIEEAEVMIGDRPHRVARRKLRGRWKDRRVGEECVRAWSTRGT